MEPTIMQIREMIPALVNLALGEEAVLMRNTATNYAYTTEDRVYMCASTVRTSRTDTPQIGVSRATVDKMVSRADDPTITGGMIYAWTDGNDAIHLVILDADLAVEHAQPGSEVSATDESVFIRRDRFEDIAAHPACVFAITWRGQRARCTNHTTKPPVHRDGHRGFRRVRVIRCDRSRTR